MALDLYRTAAQIDAALATADLGPARDRRTDAVLAALRDADASTLNARVEAAQGLLAFLPAEAVEPPGAVFDAPAPPSDFSVVATDGSHIDVNRHLPLRCALVNIGGCRLTYGEAPTPSSSAARRSAPPTPTSSCRTRTPLGAAGRRGRAHGPRAHGRGGVRPRRRRGRRRQRPADARPPRRHARAVGARRRAAPARPLPRLRPRAAPPRRPARCPRPHPRCKPRAGK